MYRVRKTVLEMLKDRGYTIAETEIEATYEEFLDYKERHAGNMNFFAMRDLEIQ